MSTVAKKSSLVWSLLVLLFLAGCGDDEVTEEPESVVFRNRTATISTGTLQYRTNQLDGALTIIFENGLGNDMAVWTAVMAEIGQSYNVVA